MGEIPVNGTPGASRNVSFAGGKMTDNESHIVQHVKEIMGTRTSEVEILEYIRINPGSKRDAIYINGVVNYFVAKGDDTDSKDAMIRSKWNSDKATTVSDAMDCTERVPYDSASPDNYLKSLEYNMQTELHDSIIAEAPVSISRPTILQTNMEEMVRNPNLSTGLYNSGNTCWSIIYHCFPYTWHQHPIVNVEKENETHAELLLLFRNLLAEMQFSDAKYIEVGRLLKVVDTLYRRSRSRGPSTIGAQQDATEMLILILNWLETAINSAIHAQLNPEFANRTNSEENLVLAESTTKAPNSDIAGTAPPCYDVENNFPSPSSSHSVPKSRPNSPTIKSVCEGMRPACSLFGTRAKDEMLPIDESMDVTETLSTKELVKPKHSAFPPAIARSHTEPSAVPEASAETRQLCETLKEQFDKIFAVNLYTATVAEDGAVTGENEIRNCPQFFHLQVSYGNLHDALEAVTFDTGLNSTSHTRNLFGNLPAVLFMGLSRFSYKDNVSTKLHDKFTFPRTIFMDRYLKNNIETVLMLRKNQLEMRKQLSLTKGQLNGLRRYPHGNGETKLVDAFRTVVEAITNTRDKEEPLPYFPFSDPFLPAPYESTITTSGSKFVEDFGKIYPTFTEENVPGIDDISVRLQVMLELLATTEQSCAKREAELEMLLENVYDVEELKQHKYELHGIIVHSGEANRGHYWTYKIKKSIDGLEEWEKLNDQNIEKVEWSAVESVAFGTGFKDSPSAYLLMYVRSDAEWLVASDKMTESEAIASMPLDLQELVLQKRENFKERLQRFREEKTTSFASDSPIAMQYSEEAPSSFSWYRDRAEEIDDENANPTKNQEILRTRLDSYQVPNGPECEMLEMRKAVEYLYNVIVQIDPKRFNDITDVLDSHLRTVMDGNRGGREFMESHLGYNIEELRVDAENDIDKVYNMFISEYLYSTQFEDADSYSRFLVFVHVHLHRVHLPVIRYLLVRALAVSNFGVISSRAQQELDGFALNSKQQEASMLKIAQLLAHIFEVATLTAWSTRVSLEHFMSAQCDEGTSADKQVEYSYYAMIGAKNARICNSLLREMGQFLDNDSIFFVTQEWIEVCTILSMMSMLKSVVQNVFSKKPDLSGMEFFTSKNEHRVKTDDIINEIRLSLHSIQLWSTVYASIDGNGRALNLPLFVRAISNKFQFWSEMPLPSTANAKLLSLSLMSSGLTSTISEPETASNALECIIVSVAEELRLSKVCLAEIGDIHLKIDQLVASYDEVVTNSF